MANFKVGQFVLNAGTGNQSVTGLTFAPKLLLFWAVAQTATGQGANISSTRGAATSSSAQWCTAASDDNGVATSVSRNIFSTTKCIKFITPAGGAEGTVSFVSMDSDGFTVNISVAPSAQYVINYAAIGGSEVNVAVGGPAMPTATGNFSVTGLAFQPTGGAFGCTGTTATSTDSINNHARESLGWATSSTVRGCTAWRSQNGVATPLESTEVSTTRVLISINTGANSEDLAVDFVSWNSDGFTLNKLSSAVATLFGYAVWSGISTFVTTMAAQTSTGNFSMTGAAFSPGLVFLQTKPTVTAAETSPTADVTLSIGAASSSSQRGSTWIGEKSALATDADQQRQDATRILMNYSPTSPFGIVGDMDFVSMDSDGWTLNQTTADTTAGLILAMALGTTGGGGGGGGGGSSPPGRLIEFAKILRGVNRGIMRGTR